MQLIGFHIDVVDSSFFLSISISLFLSLSHSMVRYFVSLIDTLLILMRFQFFSDCIQSNTQHYELQQLSCFVGVVSIVILVTFYKTYSKILNYTLTYIGCMLLHEIMHDFRCFVYRNEKIAVFFVFVHTPNMRVKTLN